MMKGIVRKLSFLYWRYVKSPLEYARHMGVTVGEETFIDTRNWSTEPYLIKIGNHVQVTQGVRFQTHGGGQSVRLFDPDFDVFGRVVVEDWAYIGACSQIMPGVTIGEGALVAAGSIVTKSVAPHTVVGGNPAKYICTTEEYYQKNKPYDVGTKRMSADQKKTVILANEDKLIKK